jgi:methylmalonyl-CoA mutase cobalamin-binding subunit
MYSRYMHHGTGVSAPAPRHSPVGPGRRALVVLATSAPEGEHAARSLARSLDGMGIDAVYMGYECRAAQIAAAVVAESVHSVELYLDGSGAVRLLRGLLRELTRLGRGDTSIVLHRFP